MASNLWLITSIQKCQKPYEWFAGSEALGAGGLSNIGLTACRL